MTDDEAAFMRTICEHPDADLPRLVFADWLEEQGQAERAEFIRLSCDLDTFPNRLPHDEFIEANRRERELFARYRVEWFGEDAYIESSLSAPQQLVIRRGFPAEVRAPLDWLRGGGCDNCEGHGGFGNYDSGPPDELCPDCHGTGRTPGHLRELVRRWPIQRVVVTDREPHQSHHDTYHWRDTDFPPDLWGLVRLHPAVIERGRWMDTAGSWDWVNFATREAAVTALSDALIEEARSVE